MEFTAVDARTSFARTLAALVASAALCESPLASAQDGSSCPLPLSKQIDAIYAFDPIAAFLTKEPRCVNCHGGVNPFISGTGSDPGDESAPASQAAHGGGRIQRQRETAPDGTVLIEGECMDCHSNMAPRRNGTKSVWMTAPGFLSFVGKDAPTLCKQIKRSTHTAEDFLGHLRDDNGGNNFGATAFNGDRGLDPETYDIPPAPPSISHAALMRLGQDWVDAMNGSFQGDESCGCTLELEGTFNQRQQMSVAPAQLAAYGGSVTANYKTNGRLVWSPKPDSAGTRATGESASLSFVPTDGEITVTIDSEGKSVAGSCEYDGSKTFQIKSLPPAALQYLQLEVGKDGRYRLMLGMVSRYLQFEVTRKCSLRAAPGFPLPGAGGRSSEIVNDAPVALGKQEGRLGDDAIAGRTATPIVLGPYLVTGEWRFEKRSSGNP